MKKFLALLLALMLVLSMATVAMAAGTEDSGTAEFTKIYVETNESSQSPEEYFYFSIVSKSVSSAADDVTVENMPVPTIEPVHFNKGAAQVKDAPVVGGTEIVEIKLPALATFDNNGNPNEETGVYTSVGIYTYTIKEVIPGSADATIEKYPNIKDKPTAGVDYHDEEITLVVTVINDPSNEGQLRIAGIHAEAPNSDKTSTITNTYSAGELSIHKTVKGNLGDKKEYFKVTVTLTGENTKWYESSYEVTGGSDTRNPKSIEIGKATEFYLRHNETITISNLPYGVTYTVVEDDYTGDKYKPAAYEYKETAAADDENAENGLVTVQDQEVNKANEWAIITNTKDGTPDTGVSLDSLPYILILAVAVVGLVIFAVKRRASAED